MRARDTASCGPGKRRTRARPTAKPALKRGGAGRSSSRKGRLAATADLISDLRLRSSDSDVIRGDIGVGLCELEAGFLSGEAGLGEISEPLREPAEHGGSELHVSAVSHGEIAARLDCGDAREF